MLVTSDILALTQAGIKTEFDDAYLKYMETAEWNLVGTDIPTTLPTQNYGWLGRGAVMKPFVDASEEQEPVVKAYSLSDIVYDAKITVKRTTLEDEQYGLVMKRINNLAQASARHWNKFVYQGLATGFSRFCHDGQYFFDNDHQEGDSPVQNNLGNSPFSDLALETTEAAMMAWVDDKGEPLNVVPDTLVVGPKNARKAADVTGSSVVVVRVGEGTASTGANAATPFSNYFQGRYKVIVSPDLIGAYANYWFLADTSREVKPIIIQTRSDVPMTLENDMMEPMAQMKEIYNIRVRERKVQGYGLWFTAFGHQL